MESKKASNTLKKIRRMIEEIQVDPFKGIGKPEPLKHNFTGMWSRRITQSDRIIYEISNDMIIIHSLKEHY